jgi:hypothetical protein
VMVGEAPVNAGERAGLRDLGRRTWNGRLYVA